MILIAEVSRNWEREGEWRIAPAGLAWIAEGHRIIVGNYARIGGGGIKTFDSWLEVVEEAIAKAEGGAA